ncbi:MAG: SRPBCC domain-containing protein [Ignavibacterium sp.]|nr:SRPBCC domain-containing protein [Ignavibacterium sp.]
MNTQIKTDFENFTFQAKREFDAPVSLVWRTYTEKEFLDQWWAPKPWKTETKNMDFRPEGKWIYDMVGPNNERHRAIQIFKEIVFEKYFSGIDAFTDELGNINETMPVATWKNTFLPTDNGTLVIVDAVYPNKEALEFVIKMGMDKGVSMAHDNLSELLNKIKIQ